MSATAETLTTPAPSVPTADFGDWLSPMLVKELRQGMRSRVFVSSFLLLQLAMVSLSLNALAGAAADSGSPGESSGFWMIIGVPLLLVLPLAGLNSLGNEAVTATLELVLLTRLTARRIIFGKWLSLVAQSLLLLCAVLPYVVLRYFIGGVDLMGELISLGLLFYFSSMLLAITVGLSPLPTRAVRILLVLGFIFVFSGLLGIVRGLAYGMPFGSMLGFTISWWHWIFLLLPAVPVMAFMVEVGAARLGPGAENHSTSMKAIGLGTLLTGALLAKWGPTGLWVPMTVNGVALSLVAALTGLCERADRPATVYRFFTRHGALGRLVGRFFYPGWPAGLLFSILLLGLWFAVAPWAWPDLRSELWKFYVGMTVCFGALIFPFAVQRTFMPSAARPFVWFIIMTVACLFLYMMASMIHSADRNSNPQKVVQILPPAGVLGLSQAPNGDTEFTAEMSGTLMATGLSLMALLFKAVEPWRRLGEAEKRTGGPRKA